MSTGSGLRWRAGVVLTLAVLGAHWLVLRSTGEALHPGSKPVQPPGPPSLQLRTVPPASRSASVTAAAEAPQVPAAQRPAPAPAVSTSIARAPAANSPQPAPPAPVAAHAPSAAPAPPAPVATAPTHTAALTVAVSGSATFSYRATAHYRGFQVDGQAQLQWRHDGSQYEARLEITLPLRPPRLQRSAGAITAQGLAPVRFSDRNRSEEAAHFDRERQRIVFSTNRPEVPLEAGAQDRLSVLLQLSALVAGDPGRHQIGSSIGVQTAGTREADPWLFTIDAQEALSLPGGTVQALRLTRQASREHESRLELWLGPGPDYAPVRLRLTQPGGDWLDLQWSGTDRG